MMLVGSILLSFLLTCAVRYLALKKAIIDIPNERSSHNIPTPRGGGIAISLTWFAAISFLFYQNQLDRNLYLALMCGLIICVVSFLDDLYSLEALPRIIVQAVSVLAALYFLGGLKKLDIGFFVIENVYILSSLAFLGALWFINLYNFIDGIDGYASMEAVIVSLGLYIFTGNYLLLILASAVLGFLPWNWQRAKIFMGDIGSTLLGFTLVIFAVYFQNSLEFSLVGWLVLTSLFWFDATYTLFKRIKNKERLNEAHKKHIYQRAVQGGLSHQSTVIFGIFINLVLLVLVWLFVQSNLILLCLLAAIIILGFIKEIVDKRKAFE